MNHQIFAGPKIILIGNILCKYSSLKVVTFFINEFSKLIPEFFSVSETNLSSLESKAHFV